MPTRRARGPLLSAEEGVREAYAAHGAELYRFALRGLGDTGAAQDAVQETFLRAWRARDRYDPQLAGLRVWLFQIARNVVIDLHRSRGARPWLGQLADHEGLAGLETAAGDGWDAQLRRWLVEEALRRVGDDHRRALEQTYLADRPYPEVAAEFGIPESTLRSRVFYGLKALRVVLEEMEVCTMTRPDDHDLGALGAYVLGQLDPAAAARVDAHLAGCAACRAERDDLLPTAAALADLKLSEATATARTAPPADLGERIVAGIDVARRRHDRTRYLRSASIAVLGAAAAAAIVVGGVAVLDSEDAAVPRAKIPLEAVPVQVDQRGITASAGIVAHTWGVEVKLTATGFDTGGRYRVDVLGTDGRRHAAGEFVGTGTAPMVCNLNSSVLRGAATGFEVRDRTGRLVVESRFG